MKEVFNIISSYEAALSLRREMALATVVRVEGSSYRRAGARMLITDDGSLTGAISGGCLEGDALRKALLVISRGQPMLVTYDTSDEEDASIGIQLGCNGIVHILIEPIDAGNSNNPVELLKKMCSERKPAVLVTLFSMKNRTGFQPGTCLLLRNDLSCNCISDPGLARHVLEDALESLNNGFSSVKDYPSFDGMTAFIGYNAVPLSLVVVGAGNDAIPLVQMAGILGWKVSVIDGRPAYATAERFPLPARVFISKPEDISDKLKPDGPTAAVLMTHNYNYDLAVLKQLLALKLPYIGSLGPKSKLQRMLQEMQEGGTLIDEEELKSIYGPVGLDLGSETSEEIALAIVAEIKAVFSATKPVSLRDKTGPIHASQ